MAMVPFGGREMRIWNRETTHSDLDIDIPLSTARGTEKHSCQLGNNANLMHVIYFFIKSRTALKIQPWLMTIAAQP